MIIDSFDNLNRFKSLSNNLGQAIAFIQSNDLNKLSLGKHEIIGNEVFVIISEYDTKSADQCKPEAHKKYIDIQMLLSGEELIGYAPLKKQKVAIEYNNDSDVVFYQSKTNKIKLYPNEFAIFFPNDIHQPGIKVNESQLVKKAVVKVKVQ